MRANGLKLLIDGTERVAHLTCTDTPAELGPQDYVFIALKAHSIPGVVDAMQPLLGPDTAIVTAVNGIPYWYFHRHGGALENSTLESIDPGGRQWRLLGPERAIGCIVYPATEITAPGVIQHVYGDKFPIGEPSGERTTRIERLSEIMAAASLRAPIHESIRDELWLKLWGNLSFNPDQRADPRHARRHHHRPRHPRRLEGHDAGGPGDRRSPRRPLPRRCRAPDQWGGGRRRA